jgi:hypothetical protein
LWTDNDQRPAALANQRPRRRPRHGHARRAAWIYGQACVLFMLAVGNTVLEYGAGHTWSAYLMLVLSALAFYLVMELAHDLQPSGRADRASRPESDDYPVTPRENVTVTEWPKNHRGW